MFTEAERAELDAAGLDHGPENANVTRQFLDQRDLYDALHARLTEMTAKPTFSLHALADLAAGTTEARDASMMTNSFGGMFDALRINHPIGDLFTDVSDFVAKAAPPLLDRACAVPFVADRLRELYCPRGAPHTKAMRNAISDWATIALNPNAATRTMLQSARGAGDTSTRIEAVVARCERDAVTFLDTQAAAFAAAPRRICLFGRRPYMPGSLAARQRGSNIDLFDLTFMAYGITNDRSMVIAALPDHIRRYARDRGLNAHQVSDDYVDEDRQALAASFWSPHPYEPANDIDYVVDMMTRI